jgi:capsular polysaccharide transport system ATP-binding protein
MITLRRAVKSVETNAGERRFILDGVTATLPKGKTIGILGGPRSGKTTLLRLFAGATVLDAGTLRTDASVSWPMGRRSVLFGAMTVRDAAMFVARLYGEDPHRVITFMRSFSGIGRDIDRNLRRCPPDVRARIQAALALSIDFDCYLIDGTSFHSNTEFDRKCWDAVLAKREEGCSLVITSRLGQPLLGLCDIGCVLADGDLMIYDDFREAVRAYRGVGLPRRGRATASASIEGVST